MKLDRTTVVKILVTVIAILLVYGFVMATCGSDEANAATVAVDEPTASAYQFTAQPVPDSNPLANATMQAQRNSDGWHCWSFGFSWSAHDPGYPYRFKFSFGADQIGCTNAAATKWVSWPKNDVWHVLGYFDWDGGSKYRSGFGFNQITLRSYWNFKWQPPGLPPLVHQHRELACNFLANNHTAYCTLYSSTS